MTSKRFHFATISLLLIVVATMASAHAVSIPPLAEAIEGSRRDVLLLLLYVALALGFSFLCSIAEAVLLSITPSYIESQRETRPRRAAMLKRLKQDNIDQSLAAILTLNTIAHTVGAIAAGAKASVVFGSTWFGVFSAVMTLLILFLSEIVPKTIGAVFWPRLVGFTALFVRTLIVSLYPLVWISEKMTRLISGGKNVHIFSREEFIAMSRVGEQQGLLNDKESRVLRNLFRFGTLRVRDVMTPRSVMSTLPDSASMKEAFAQATEKPFSRFPVYQDNRDNIVGFVLKDDIYLNMAQERTDVSLQSIRRDLLAVPEIATLSVLMEQLIKERHHLAIVVNEYGETLGLVTLEDLLETLIGMEIVDESDAVADMQGLARELWRKRAAALGIVEPDPTPSTDGDRPQNLSS